MTGQRMPIDTMVRHCYVSGGAKRAYKMKRKRPAIVENPQSEPVGVANGAIVSPNPVQL